MGRLTFGVIGLFVIILFVGALASVDDRVAVPVRERRERSLGLLNNLVDVKVQTCGVSCEDPSYCCEAGYFCIRNALCLRGSPSDYEDAAFIGVGVILGIIASAEHISLTSQCVDDVFDSVDSALRTFDDWDSGNRDEAMGDLRSLFSDLEKTWNACRASASEPWWEKLINVAIKIVTDFFPEVKAVATGVEIVLHGENIYNDYERMHQYCGATLLRRGSATPSPIAGSYSDLVNCGIGIGDFGYEIYEILTDDEDEDEDHMRTAPSKVTANLYTDNYCAKLSGSVSAELHECIAVPECPEVACQSVFSCAHKGSTLQEVLACLGCKHPLPLNLQFSVDGPTLVESLFYQSATCGTPMSTASYPLNYCVSLTNYQNCTSGGSFMLTSA